jgi:PAS domain S-box-containing protein
MNLQDYTSPNKIPPTFRVIHSLPLRILITAGFVLGVVIWLVDLGTHLFTIENDQLVYLAPPAGDVVLRLLATLPLIALAIFSWWVYRHVLLLQARAITERDWLRILIDNLPDHLYIKDADGRFVVANWAVTRHLGVDDPAALIGRNHCDLLSPEAAARNRAQYQDLLHGDGPVFHTEESTTDDTGFPVWWLKTQVPVKNDRDAMIGVVEIARDITDNKLVEMTLRELNSQLNATLNALPVLLFELDQEGRLYDYHSYNEELLYRSPAEFLGKRLVEVLPAPVGQMLDVELGYHVKTGEPGHGQYELETPVGLRAFEFWLTTKEISEGTAAHYLLLVHDITEKHQAEMALEELLHTEREQRLIAETLREVTLTLASQSSSDAVLDEILLQVERLVGYTTASITRYEDEKLYLLRWHGDIDYSSHEIETRTLAVINPSSLPLYPATIQDLDATLLVDTQAEARWRIFPGLEWVRSHLAMPITLRGELLGVLLLNHLTPGHFTVQDVARLEPLMNAAAIALENARLYEQAQQEIQERKQAEAALQTAYDDLEVRVQTRTQELAKANQLLQAEVQDRTRMEHILREREEIYRALVEQSNDALYLLQNGRMVFVNQRFQEMFGVTPEDVFNADFNLLDLVAADSRAVVKDRLRQFAEGAEIATRYEYTARNTANYDFEVEAFASEVQYGGRRALQVLLRDITDRRMAEQALRDSEERFRSAFATAAIGMALVDTDGYYLQVNDALGQLYGYSTSELLSMRYQDLTYPEDLIDAPRLLHILLHETPVFHQEKRYTHRDGHIIWAIVSLSTVRSTDGRPLYIVVQVQDITEKKHAELENERLLAQLQHRNTQLHTASEISKSASTILEPDLLIGQTVNLIRSRFRFYYVGLFLRDADFEYAVLQAGTGDAGARMLAEGHKLRIGGSSMIGQCVANNEARIALDVGQEAVRFDNPHLPLTRSEMALPLTTSRGCIGGLTVHSDQAAAFSEEDVVVLQSMVEQVAIAIENARLYNAAQDEIFRRIEAEEAIKQLNESLERRVMERTAELAAANKELEAFAYSVSHDLRAPLRSIDGFSQALEEDYGDRFDEEGRDYLNRVRAASQRMDQLINDLLNLSRVTRAEMHREEVDLSDIAHEINDFLMHAEPGRSMTLDIAPALKAYGDPRLLRIVLENLFSNAWKFTRKQEASRIEFGMTDEAHAPDATGQNGMLVYYVRDDGAGFDMAYANKLFGAFQRLHPVSEFEGNGIGLATVQRIISRHGGHVWAESEPGQGATFFFTLPGPVE